MSYIVYVKHDCNGCDKALQLLQLYGKTFKTIELGKDMPLLDFMREFPDVKAVPLVTLDFEQFRSIIRLSTHLSEKRNEELTEAGRSPNVRRIHPKVETPFKS